MAGLLVPSVTPASGPTFSGARVTKSASQSLSSGTWTVLTFNTEQFDVGAYHDTVTNTSRLTIPAGKSGYFLVYGAVEFAPNATGVRQLSLLKNGSDVLLSQDGATTGTYRAGRQVAIIINAVATDYFELSCRQDSGSTVVVEGGTDSANFCITYLGA